MKGGIYIAAVYVKCAYCGNTFDRTNEMYVKINSRRYAHATCYLRKKEENPKLENFTIVDPLDEVECIYCKKKFFKSKTKDFTILSNGKYAHKKCLELEEKRELTDKEKLDKLIIDLYELDFVPPRVQKQIKDYITQYNYTYTGIAKTLQYIYTIKNVPLDKIAFNTYGIGLVKNYYERAHDYYFSIWEAKQKQEYILDTSSVEAFVPKTIEITIPVPKRQELKRQLFSFLDNEEVINE